MGWTSLTCDYNYDVNKHILAKCEIICIIESSCFCCTFVLADNLIFIKTKYGQD